MPALAQPDSCGEVRLDLAADSLQRLPIYDQQGINNCYAMTVAQAADAWRFSHGDKRTWRWTSPTHLSVLFAYEQKLVPLEIAKDWGSVPPEEANRRMSRVSMNAGSPKDTFALLRKHGSCDLKGFVPHSDQLLVESIWIHVKRLSELAEEEKRGISPEEVQCFKEGLSPFRNSIWLVRAFTEAMSKKYPIEIMKDGMERICARRRLPMSQLPREISLDVSKDSPAERLRLVHAALDQKLPQPPVVSYCLRLLNDKTARTTENLKASDEPCRDRPGKFDGHVSLVVGRKRAENGKCQLLIRNSFGPDCYDRISKKGYDWKCEGGQIWVDEDALANNSYFVSYLPGN